MSGLLSGEATMVINRLYEGVQSILGNEVEMVTAYDGHSYEVKNAPGISIQDGFSFHANTAQEFFILLDDNYAYPPVNENYVWVETILKEGLTEKDDIYFASAHERQGNCTYYDGLGRAVQQIARKASPTEKDIVTPIQYDPVGRIEKEFLPFESTTGDGMLKADAYAAQSEFYLSPPEKISPSTHAFSKKIFEQSPLNRVLEQGAPGTDWQPSIGHAIRLKESTNGANEIGRWRINYETQMPGVDGFYSANELDLQETIDEHGNSVKQYIDKQGLLIEKHVQLSVGWLRTIYAYDDLGLLRYVIQPEGVANLEGDPDQNFLDMWAFQYKYDKRERLIEKRVPGGGWTYYVYDKRDRLAMTQDANQYEKNEWSYTKYDALNRPVMTGIYHCYEDYQNNGQVMSRASMQEKYAQTGIAEARTNWSMFGYTNSVFPTQGTTVISITFYDDYSFVGMGYFSWDNYYSNNALEGLPNTAFDKVKGLVTGTLIFVEDSDEYNYNDIYIHSTNWYDSKYRVIQTLSNNHLGGQDRVSMRYDFVGNVVARSHVHSKNQTSHTLLEEFTYDHAGRILVHSHTLDNEPRVVLKNSSYNALGQLVEANLHLKGDGSYQQSVDYRYNIRGWLTHINNASLSDDGGETNDEANDFFGFELKYNNPDHDSQQFNGNISQVNWKTSGSPSGLSLYVRSGKPFT